jgi:tRNA nucleotidyltransferase (CCA-adding enzyme)
MGVAGRIFRIRPIWACAAVGPTLAAAFEQAALAMTAVVTDPAGVAPALAVDIDCEAPDDELLLVDWLNALILEMAARHLLFGRFEVTLDGHRLHATAWGETVDTQRHQPAVEIKGATYTELKVGQGRIRALAGPVRGGRVK